MRRIKIMIKHNKLMISSFAIMVSTYTLSSEVYADSFSKYNDLVSMRCIGENGSTQFVVQNNRVSILDNDPMIFDIDGKIVKKNGNKQQYIINLGIIEYFLDFDSARAVINSFGMTQELTCF